ncbi:MAG: 6,7-dimethyl-8-ribityllumazine synthase [Nevskiaceae bacterium]|jgi:6,7-dimethyl-8-ribityllumazine synthase|nr:6,7-dimethyl-8-ribityllumazine synthase [Nevskiaceae bacterium]
MPNYRIIDGAQSLQHRESKAGDAASDLRVAVVAARFNADIVDAMLDGALAAWQRQGGAAQDLTIVRAPGAFELPLLARALANTGLYDAIVALGCVIRGDTAHFDFVAGEAARGIAQAAYDTGVPVAFGVLTTENVEQALERAQPARMDKGGEALEAAIEMALALREIARS